jgi:hypothetical protein
VIPLCQGVEQTPIHAQGAPSGPKFALLVVPWQVRDSDYSHQVRIDLSLSPVGLPGEAVAMPLRLAAL